MKTTHSLVYNKVNHRELSHVKRLARTVLLVFLQHLKYVFQVDLNQLLMNGFWVIFCFCLYLANIAQNSAKTILSHESVDYMPLFLRWTQKVLPARQLNYISQHGVCTRNHEFSVFHVGQILYQPILGLFFFVIAPRLRIKEIVVIGKSNKFC